MSLRIYSFTIETLRAVAPLIKQGAKHDLDLVRQLRRAAASIALNIAEGGGAKAATNGCAFEAHTHRRRRSARASMSRKRLHTSTRSTPGRDRFDRIAATLYRLAT